MSPVPKADHLRTELISDALTNAVSTRDPKADVVFHSGAAALPSRSSPATTIRLLVGLAGQCWDNALAESSSSASRASASIPEPGHQTTPAGPSSSTSAGSTAAVCTVHWSEFFIRPRLALTRTVDTRTYFPDELRLERTFG